MAAIILSLYQYTISISGDLLSIKIFRIMSEKKFDFQPSIGLSGGNQKYIDSDQGYEPCLFTWV